MNLSELVGIWFIMCAALGLILIAILNRLKPKEISKHAHRVHAGSEIKTFGIYCRSNKWTNGNWQEAIFKSALNPSDPMKDLICDLQTNYPQGAKNKAWFNYDNEMALNMEFEIIYKSDKRFKRFIQYLNYLTGNL